jgi:3-methylfumaryl-CoA hydratase
VKLMSNSLSSIDDSVSHLMVRNQALTRETLRRIAAMLDLGDPDLLHLETAPAGWHFPLIGAETKRSDLRLDGFPGLGLPVPHVSCKRLVAAGRKVDVHASIPVDQELARTSRVASLVPKSNGVTVLRVDHAIVHASGALLLAEEQTYIFLDARYAGPANHVPQSSGHPVVQTITPDDTLLFQFSALSFNSHRIHLDRDFARSVEGYPDLVVNGGLTTLLMTELARSELAGGIRRMVVRNTAPLFVNRPLHLTFGMRDGKHLICALDADGHLAAEMEFETDGI